MPFSSANTLTHPITHTFLQYVNCVLLCNLQLCFMAILPRSSSLRFTFELFNLLLELAMLRNYNVQYMLGEERLKENLIVVVRTESEKVGTHSGSNRVTLNCAFRQGGCCYCCVC